MTAGSEPTNGRATIREVYDLLDGMEDRLDGKRSHMEARLDQKLAHLEDKISMTMLAHQQEHTSQRKEATDRLRWLIGSVLGMGTIILTAFSLWR
jgi:hypothetical protein